MYISRRKHNRATSLPCSADDIGARKDAIEACEKITDIEYPDTVPLPEMVDSAEERIFAEEDGAHIEEPIYVERELHISESEDTADSSDGSETDNDIAVPSNPQVLDDDMDNAAVLTYDEFTAQNTSSGVLRVQASAGGQSIPLANVRVTVYKDLLDGRHVFYTVITDADGVADGMTLPAPPAENSVSGNGLAPFASYSIIAERDGMRGENIENVPIFASVKSIQPITLVSMPAEV